MAAGPSTQPASVVFGPRIMALADALARFSETTDGLTCTYLSDAHRAVAEELRSLMDRAGMEVATDAAGNVVGRYAGRTPDARTLILASHYDTVRNAGKYDGRLGVLLPLVVVEHLHGRGTRLPFGIEMIAFSEEEGVRFAAPYIGSGAVTGRFDPRLLARRDVSGVSMAEAMRAAGLDPAAIPTLARDRERLLGYLEVHIEQGPVLLSEDLPVGIVTGIAGNVRLLVTITGEAGHAGTVPMGLRRDAAAAAAEIVLYVERCCSRAPTLVGTVGRLAVPDGAINVIPGRCELSLDIRAADDRTRDAALRQVVAEIGRIAIRRKVEIATTEVLRMPAVPCSAAMQARLAEAITRAGIAPRHLASGAGHDMVMFGGLTEVGMLFVRCGNGGVSHSPRETITAEDAEVAARIVLDVLMNFAP
jgi:allantoate deiminase/N-carbamoyl-L-amino-acid hydrolase